jgi:hypothetical protein
MQGPIRGKMAIQDKSALDIKNSKSKERLHVPNIIISSAHEAQNNHS